MFSYINSLFFGVNPFVLFFVGIVILIGAIMLNTSLEDDASNNAKQCQLSGGRMEPHLGDGDIICVKPQKE